MPLYDSFIGAMITGTTAPTAGKIGEQLISSVATTSLPASGTWGDVTSLSLTAGVWGAIALRLECHSCHSPIKLNYVATKL